MNNNTTEDYVSFEVAKLLKEKGFKQQSLCFFFEDGEFRQNVLVETTGMDYGSEFTVEYTELLENWNDNFLTKKDGSRCFGCSKSKGYFETFSSPTQALAIKWIRENFGIICTHTMPTKINNKWLFGGKVFSMENEADNMVIGAFDSPEEAIEAALLHTLKNLIP